MFPFQMLTSVLRAHIIVVMMLCATIPKDRTTVHVNLDILEMDGIAKVNLCPIFVFLKTGGKTERTGFMAFS